MSLTTTETTAVPAVNAVAFSLAPAAQQPKHEERPPSEVEKLQKKVSREEAQNSVKELNAALEPLNTELTFTVDKDTDKMVVKIVNTKTHEVIRQIPAEDVLRIASRIRKLLGVLVDGNA